MHIHLFTINNARNFRRNLALSNDPEWLINQFGFLTMCEGKQINSRKIDSVCNGKALLWLCECLFLFFVGIDF